MFFTIKSKHLNVIIFSMFVFLWQTKVDNSLKIQINYMIIAVHFWTLANGSINLGHSVSMTIYKLRKS